MKELVGCILKGSTVEFLALPNKNDPNVWEDFMFWDEDTGDIWNFENGWTLISGPNRAEVLKNKNIPANLNSFQNVLQDPLVNNRREGIFIPALSADKSVKFALGGLPFNGTYSYIYSQDLGRFSTSIIESVGYLSNSTNKVISRISWNTSFKILCKPSDVAHTREYVGFTSNINGLSFTDTPLGNSDAGIIMGYDNTNNNFAIWRNDGLGTPIRTDLGVQKDNVLHTLSMDMSTQNGIFCYIDTNNPIQLTTRLPGQSADLYLFMLMQNMTAAANYLDIAKVRLSSNIT
jgi:hypothetical protein